MRLRHSDIVFFLTGASALVCETVWARLLARVLGSDAGAGAVVLATFMGGMGIGALSFARLAHEARRPVFLFAGLELFIGAWAAASPWILESLHPVDGYAARALIAAAVLLPPTLAMGASFPLMGRIAIGSDEATAQETSAFYAANTLGGALGCLLGPAAFMPLFGLSGALRAAALLELAAVILACSTLKVPVRADPAVEPQAFSARAQGAWQEPLLWIALVMGATSLALEVLLLRLLVTVTGASVYAFALVVGVFLIGIAVGSRQLVAIHRGTREPTIPARGPQRDITRTVFYSVLAVPILTLLGLLFLRHQLGESDLFTSLANRVPEGAGLPRLWASHVFLCGVAMLPPAVAFGLALPACAASLIERHPGSARERWLGLLYGFNTGGALFGSLAAAFVMLPHLGLRWSIAIVLCWPFVAALCVPRMQLRTALLALGLAGMLSAWLLGSHDSSSPRKIIVHAFDAHESVAVEDTPGSNGQSIRSIRINGKPEASTAPVDQRLQLLLGHIPGLLHGHVKKALVIGLGTGMTAGSLLDLPDLEHLTIFEISPAVRSAAQAFAEFNGRVLDDPRTEVVIADGRHALATSDERYDLITSDPVHPWTRGSSDLYTLEHFESMARHLAPGGIASQWLPLYELSTEDVKTIVATWCAAFEHTSAWLTAYDLALVGSRARLDGSRAGPDRSRAELDGSRSELDGSRAQIDGSRAEVDGSRAALDGERRLSALELPPRVARSLSRVGIGSGLDIAALEVADDDALRELARGVSPMRDDRPVLEFHAPLSYLAGYSTEILRWAARADADAHLSPGARARAAENRALLVRFLDRLPSGWGPAAEEYGRELLSLSRHEPR